MPRPHSAYKDRVLEQDLQIFDIGYKQSLNGFLMVVQEKSRVEMMEGNQHRVDVNILLLGAHNVGKSGE